jgi:sugar (pentulose or hexulose) kinase
LALKVAVVLRQLESLTGKRYPALHVVGGGAQDALLMRAIANAVERPVLAGPVEATALGNALVQMMGGGAVGSLEEARAIVRTAFPPADYLPENADDWRAARERFEELVGRVEKS